ncbi:hypothetical protein [Phormidesmis sp. 146-33]
MDSTQGVGYKTLKSYFQVSEQLWIGTHPIPSPSWGMPKLADTISGRAAKPSLTYTVQPENFCLILLQIKFVHQAAFYNDQLQVQTFYLHHLYKAPIPARNASLNKTNPSMIADDDFSTSRSLTIK